MLCPWLWAYNDSKIVTDKNIQTQRSLWAETPKIFVLRVTFIRIWFIGTELKLIISRLDLDWGKKPEKG